MYHEVDVSLTEEDRLFIPKFMVGIEPLPEPKNRSYEDELHFIISIQRSVLENAPVRNPLPFGSAREPRDLYEAKIGLCYDKSRTIEKIFRFSGLAVRHFAMYQRNTTDSALKTVLSSATSSHSVTEVLTKKGWLVVDSYFPWVSVDRNNDPISIRGMQEGYSSITWATLPPAAIYQNSFIVVYGLYSRHGMFYPPYNFIPDVNYSELVQNML